MLKRESGFVNKSQFQSIKDLKERISPIIKNNEFCFLNKSVSFPNEIEWQSNEFEKLWLYNLHYFDYAFELGIANLIEGDSAFFEAFKLLVVDWIEKNRKIGYGYGWEPYPVSLRIVNWIYAYNLFIDKIKDDEEFKIKFLESIAIQTEFLCNNIEYHVCRNHLIKNGKALFLAGVFFHGGYALKWKARGISILINESEEQILDDGGHFERSPMYHLIVLQDYLEMFILSERNNINFPVYGKLEKMLIFLANIIHPDNQIPLLNDSAFGIAKDPGELFSVGSYFIYGLSDFSSICKTTLYTVLLIGEQGLRMVDRRLQDSKVKILRTENGGQRAEGRGQTVGDREEEVAQASLPVKQTTLFKNSGFCVVRSKKNDKFMIISCKGPSPYYLPGHSHSDMLSYELSLGYKRFIIDSGVNNYLQGECRDYFRSTRAHNTLTVNGQDQSELWGTFGIARRAKLQSVRLNTINNHAVFFESALKGFPSLNTIYHQRSIYFIDDLFWFIFDTIKSDCNDLKSYKIESFIHVHPDRSVKFVKSPKDGESVIINEKRENLSVCPARINTNLCDNDGLKPEIISGDEKVTQGWYSPEFGNRIKNNVIVIKKEGNLPMHIGYVLFPSNENSYHISALCKITTTEDSESNILDIQIETPDSCYFIKRDGTDIKLKRLRIKD